MKKLISTVLLLSFAVLTFAQQTLPFDRTSPRAEVTQYVGAFAFASVEYSRPFVRNRQVFGDLVPFGLADDNFGPKDGMPWRTGADENTVLTLSHDAIVGGENVPRGTYSIHTIPGENEWTIILNTNSSGWGSYFYDENNDVARFTVPVQESAFTENFTIFFDSITKSGFHIYIQWDKTKVSVPVTFDVHSINLDEYDKLLTSLPGFNPQAWAQAAQYCVNNGVEFQRGLIYANKAVAMSGGNNFSYTILAAQLHQLAGDIMAADAIINEKIAEATERHLSVYGNWLMQQERWDRAIEILVMNVKKNSKSWAAHQVLAKAYLGAGNIKEAESSYKSAIKNASGAQKTMLQSELDAI